MSNRFFRVSIALWVLGFAAMPTYAQSKRTIEVKVIDAQDQPIVDASVIVRTAFNGSAADESGFVESRWTLLKDQVNTDATGIAKIDLADELGNDIDAPVSVAVWKVGYGPQLASVQNKVEFKLRPLRKRTVQIVDAEGLPQNGLRVEHAVEEHLAGSPSAMRWWTEDFCLTDEFGLATLEAPATGSLSLAVTESDGTLHRVQLSEGNRLNGRLVDPRDVSTVRLSPHGQVEGHLPPEFVKDFGVRLMRDYRAALHRNFELWSSLADQVKVSEDGSFRADAVVDGSYWLIVYRQDPYDSAMEQKLTELPVSIQRIEVVAGKVTTIQIGRETSAKVTGRVVGGDDRADYTGLRLVFNRAIPSQATGLVHEGHNVARAECAADGTFTCWLPAGRFRVTPIATAKWKAGNGLDFEVGRGAATITTPDISVVPTDEVKVQWLREERLPPTLLSYIDNRIVFVTGEGERSECSLTADGYGRVRLPVGAEVQSITREILYGRGTEPSSFVDRDPSANFDLELIRNPQGMSTNVALRGRAVEPNGRGVGGVPVSVSLTYEPLAGANMSLRQGGSQLLDIAWTAADGTYQIPARQLFRRMTVPGREISLEGRFTFTISTRANPNPIEVERAYTVKPSEWDMLDIELPDLIVDRPLGGQQLKGKLLDREGKPSAGERVRLADKREVIRTLTDRNGEFMIEGLAGPVWLLRERDWSIHAVSDYAQPITLTFKSIDEPPSGTKPAERWQRADQQQRQALAKELLKTIPTGQGMLRVVPNLSDDFYLEPEKFYRQLLVARGPGSDEARLRFVNFWSSLSDQQLQGLADSMEQAHHRIQIMRMIADRHPSAAAYSEVMNAIVAPQTPDENGMATERMLDHLAAVGLKLHHYGILDTSKISEFLALRAAQTARMAGNPREANRARPDTDSIVMCRALLDPLQFAAEVGEAGPVDPSELNSEFRVQDSRNRDILLRLFPAEFEKYGRFRGYGLEQVMIDLAELAPLDALAAVKQGKLSLEYLRVISAVALNSGRAEASQVFNEGAQLLLRIDHSRFRPSQVSSGGLNVDLNWYRAARRASVEFRKIVQWHLAHDYLSGRYDDLNVSILSVRDRNFQQMLTAAYCLSEDYPELATLMAQRAVPQMLKSAEQELAQSFSRASDISLAAWFEPQATTELLIKISKQLDEEKKQQGARIDTRSFSKTNTLMSLRDSCLRGLLLDEF